MPTMSIKQLRSAVLAYWKDVVAPQTTRCCSAPAPSASANAGDPDRMITITCWGCGKSLLTASSATAATIAEQYGPASSLRSVDDRRARGRSSTRPGLIQQRLQEDARKEQVPKTMAYVITGATGEIIEDIREGADKAKKGIAKTKTKPKTKPEGPKDESKRRGSAIDIDRFASLFDDD